MKQQAVDYRRRKRPPPFSLSRVALEARFARFKRKLEALLVVQSRSLVIYKANRFHEKQYVSKIEHLSNVLLNSYGQTFKRSLT